MQVGGRRAVLDKYAYPRYNSWYQTKNGKAVHGRLEGSPVAHSDCGHQGMSERERANTHAKRHRNKEIVRRFWFVFHMLLL